MPQEDKLQLLYDDVRKDYDVGSMDDFKKYLSDDKKRAAFYKDIVLPNYDVKSQDEFENIYGLKKKSGGGNELDSEVQSITDPLSQIKNNSPQIKADITNKVKDFHSGNNEYTVKETDATTPSEKKPLTADVIPPFDPQNPASGIKPDRLNLVKATIDKTQNIFKANPTFYSNPKNRDTYYNSLLKYYSPDEVAAIRNQDTEHKDLESGDSYRPNPLTGQMDKVKTDWVEKELSSVFLTPPKTMVEGLKKMDSAKMLYYQGHPLDASAVMTEGVLTTTFGALGMTPGAAPTMAAFNAATPIAQEVAPKTTEWALDLPEKTYELFLDKPTSEGGKALMSVANTLWQGASMFGVHKGAEHLVDTPPAQWTKMYFREAADIFKNITPEQQVEAAHKVATDNVEGVSQEALPKEVKDHQEATKTYQETKDAINQDPILGNVIPPEKVEEDMNAAHDTYAEHATSSADEGVQKMDNEAKKIWIENKLQEQDLPEAVRKPLEQELKSLTKQDVKEKEGEPVSGADKPVAKGQGDNGGGVEQGGENKSGVSKEFTAEGGNKVVDEKGQPLTVYHATDADFEHFDIGKSKKMGNFGIWFSESKEGLEPYGKNIKEVNINLKNPKIISFDEWNNIRAKHAKDANWFNNWKKQLQEQGYDGLKINEGSEMFAGEEMKVPITYAAFENEQVKNVKGGEGEKAVEGGDGKEPSEKETPIEENKGKVEPKEGNNKSKEYYIKNKTRVDDNSDPNYPRYYYKDEFIKKEGAKPVKLQHEGDFFYHKDGNYFVISEATTGVKIAEGKTLKEATKTANDAINKVGKDEYQNKLQREIDKHGKTPPYQEGAKETPKASPEKPTEEKLEPSNIAEEKPPKPPKKEEVENDFESQQGKKSLATRVYEGKTPEEIRNAVEKHGLNYEIESHANAESMATGFINDVGVENALKAVRKDEVKGGGASFVFAKAIDSIHNEFLLETDPAKKLELAEKESDLIAEFDQRARESGQFISALHPIYQVSDLGYKLGTMLQRIKDANGGEDVSEILKKKIMDISDRLEEVNKKLAESEEKRKEAESKQSFENIKEDIGRKQKLGKTKNKEIAKKLLKAVKEDKDPESAKIFESAKRDKVLAKIADILKKDDKETISGAVDKVSKEENWTPEKTEKVKDYLNEKVGNEEEPTTDGKLKIPHSLIREKVINGAKDIHELVDALKENYPDASDREIRDAVTNYGKTANPNTEEIEVEIRRMKRIGRLTSALEDVQNKKRPLKSGLQRDKLDVQERKLQKQLREEMKSLPIDEAANARELKNAQDRITSRLKNRIEDLDRQIEEGKKDEPNKPIEYNEENKALREQAAQLKSILDDLVGDKELSKEDRIKRAISAVERSEAEYERRIKEKEFVPTPKEELSSPELDAAKEKRNAAKEQFDKLKKESPEGKNAEEQKKHDVALKSVENSIDKINKEIEDLQKGIEKQQKPKLQSASIEAAKKRREEARVILDKMKEDLGIVQAKKLQAIKDATQKNIDEYKRRIEEGDFSKKEKKETPLDYEAKKLKLEQAKIKEEYNKELEKVKYRNRTTNEKIRDGILKYRRAALLSGVKVLAKLSSAAVTRQFLVSPIEEAIGGVLSKAPLLERVASQAPRQGNFNSAAEAKSIAEAFKAATYADIWNTFKTGKSELDLLYGKGKALPPEALDFFGNLHSALKVLPKRGEFERSFEKRTQWYIENGINAEDPMIQMEIGALAYEDALRSIFMNDNAVTSAYKGFLQILENKGASGTANVLNFLLPIVKVPTNFFAETVNYVPVVGAIKSAKILAKGVENLTPEQADMVMQTAKKQTIGTALLLIGYFNSNNIGGYYSQGERREGDVKFGDIKIMGMEVPHYVLHNPAMEMLQIGATIHRWQNKYTNVGLEGGTKRGVEESVIGVMKQQPFIGESVRSADAFRNGGGVEKFGKDIAQSLLVPQLFNEVSSLYKTKEDEDKDKQKKFEESYENKMKEKELQKPSSLTPTSEQKELMELNKKKDSELTPQDKERKKELKKQVELQRKETEALLKYKNDKAKKSLEQVKPY